VLLVLSSSSGPQVLVEAGATMMSGDNPSAWIKSGPDGV